MSGTKIRAWVATRYAEALDTASLVDSWDEADTTKRGSLDEAEFLVFAAALEAAAARVAAKLAASAAADRTPPAPPPEAEGQTAAVDAACGGWDAPAAVSVLALVASCLVDDGEDPALLAEDLRNPKTEASKKFRTEALEPVVGKASIRHRNQSSPWTESSAMIRVAALVRRLTPRLVF